MCPESAGHVVTYLATSLFVSLSFFSFFLMRVTDVLSTNFVMYLCTNTSIHSFHCVLIFDQRLSNFYINLMCFIPTILSHREKKPSFSED